VKALRECESSKTSQAPEARDESQEQTLAAAFQAPASRSGRVEFGRYVGWVVGATSFVVILPTAFVWWLRSEGIVRSPLLTLVIALVATLAASRAGTAYWEKRTSPGDLLFGELLLWGFIRRCNSERRLNSARAVLGSLADTRNLVGEGQTPDDQAAALEKLSAALESTDPYTHGHSRRVARHCWMIAKRMGLDSETVARVRTAAALHDVGKVYTPPSVLRKPGRLTDEEFDVIKRHPVDGAELVKALGDDELVSIVRHHHERLDGTGYPDRLVRDQIPIGARIISVADTFDAITSARPYRPARAHKKALDILKYEAGTQLDPAVVKAFCAIYTGRRPLAVWASFTSLPSQVFSWLGAGAATAASAAQVAAVATAAAVGVTAAMPTHHGSRRHSRSSDHVQIAEVASHRLSGASLGDTASAATALVGGSHRKHPASVASGLHPASVGTGTTSAGGSTGATGTTRERRWQRPAEPRRALDADRIDRHRESAPLGSKRIADRHGSAEAGLGVQRKQNVRRRQSQRNQRRKRSQGSEGPRRKSGQRSEGQRRKRSQRTQSQTGKRSQRSQRSQSPGRKSGQRSQGQGRKRSQGQTGKRSP